MWLQRGRRSESTEICCFGRPTARSVRLQRGRRSESTEIGVRRLGQRRGHDASKGPSIRVDGDVVRSCATCAEDGASKGPSIRVDGDQLGIDFDGDATIGFKGAVDQSRRRYSSSTMPTNALGLLQRGRRSESTEMRTSFDAEVIHCGALQRGRRSESTEIFVLLREGIDARVASKGPSIRVDGDIAKSAADLSRLIVASKGPSIRVDGDARGRATGTRRRACFKGAVDQSRRR